MERDSAYVWSREHGGGRFMMVAVSREGVAPTVRVRALLQRSLDPGLIPIRLHDDDDDANDAIDL
jgi:hypothetical protein